ncbi:MAG: prolipoprotein diacylglyceryl transferase [Acidocella sp. 20-57-95]|nr:MAG: prolipoprotein diacylglyceryl transferase [Acidocella sp. 20-57-95]OYV57588.1 MAG: prolipoprotein diacylglyceryl transferase [Acidocella sp. 21-58-7]HQT63652.1 prolipoprotein diacylglyceryl transferase [Acidocella sp.]HQU04072.1 prolipoprotein diacylglyceryl transferase [Acidocella sp.]
MSPIILPEFPKGFHIGPLFIHYYALAYITGLLLGWRLVRRMCAEKPVAASGLQVDDFLTWATLGVILGGRLGYVLFYQPGYFFTHPPAIFAVWDGGMSSHGGFIGVSIAIIWFCKKQGLNILRFADRISIAVPIGLGLGRIANFINGELWGRPAAPGTPFAMIFPSPDAGGIPRYPSELIEAATEGVLLFIFMLLASRSSKLRASPGKLTGLFLILYACARIFSECFREPDPFLGFLSFGATMGQLLSLPMIVIGLGFIAFGAKLSPNRDDVP